MFDTVRGYAAVAAGLAEAGARAAWQTVSSWRDDGDATAFSAAATLPRQVQDTVDGVLASSRQNSELLVGVVRTEVERAVGRLGFVREEELAAVRRHVSRLETQLVRLTGRAPDPTGVVPDAETPAETPAAPPASQPATKAAKKPAKKAVKKPAKKPVTKATATPVTTSPSTADRPPSSAGQPDPIEETP